MAWIRLLWCLWHFFSLRNYQLHSLADVSASPATRQKCKGSQSTGGHCARPLLQSKRRLPAGDPSELVARTASSRSMTYNRSDSLSLTLTHLPDVNMDVVCCWNRWAQWWLILNPICSSVAFDINEEVTVSLPFVELWNFFSPVENLTSSLFNDFFIQPRTIQFESRDNE